MGVPRAAKQWRFIKKVTSRVRPLQGKTNFKLTRNNPLHNEGRHSEPGAKPWAFSPTVPVGYWGTPWQYQKERLGMRGPLGAKNMAWMDRFGVEQGHGGDFQQRHGLEQGLQDAFAERFVPKVARAETRFERVLMDEAADRDIEARVERHRKRDDDPLEGENPYSDGRDLRMGAATPVRDLLPVLLGRLRFTDRAAVARCVAAVAADAARCGDVLTRLAAPAGRRDGSGGEAWAARMRERHGAAWTHVELLARAAVSQEAARRQCARMTRQGTLTPAPGERVYALAGTVRAAKGLRPAGRPGWEEADGDVRDPGSWGAWRWYTSDFGTDIDSLRDRERLKIVTGFDVRGRNAKHALHFRPGQAVIGPGDGAFTVRTGIRGGKKIKKDSVIYGRRSMDA